MSDTIKDDKINDQEKFPSNAGVFGNIVSNFSNSYHTFVLKKSERLASALYVITGFMPQEEPVRNRLRVCALELITRSSNPLELTDSGADAFEYRCAEIGTILQTANYAGLISETNARLIGEEYAALAGFVRTHSGKIAERGRPLQRSSITEPKSVSGSIRQHKSLLPSDKKDKGQYPYKKSDDLKSRKSIILGLFNSKKEISLKDTTSLIPDVSEKTLQRDLISMANAGVLIKKGTRRWTTYQKAAPETSENV